MRIRLVAWGMMLSLVALLWAGCDDDRKPCVACPEPDPAIVVALNYIDGHRAELGLREEVDQMVSYRVLKDDMGMTHVRFYQYYKGVRVEGGELIVHLSAALEVTRVSGEVVRDVQVDTNVTISAGTAARIAQEDFQSDGFHVIQEGLIETIVIRWNDIDHLCWTMVFNATDAIDIRQYFVDAHSGEIVYWRSLIIVG